MQRKKFLQTGLVRLVPHQPSPLSSLEFYILSQYLPTPSAQTSTRAVSPQSPQEVRTVTQHGGPQRQLAGGTANYPIFFLSWGEPHCFVLTNRRSGEGQKVDLVLKGGDLLGLEGECRSTRMLCLRGRTSTPRDIVSGGLFGP